MIRSLLLALVVCSALPAGEVAIALRASVVLDAERATLGDIAELTGDEALITVLRGVTIAELPDLRPRHLEADEVRRAIGLGLGRSLTITGQSDVSRRGQQITQDELVALAKAAVPSDGDTVTISLLRSTGPVTFPAGGIEPTIVATAMDNARAGDIPFRVRVMRGEVELGRALVTLRIVREREVLVASRAIRRGERLGPGDIRSERMVLGKASTSRVGIEDVIGREARNDLAEGTPFSPAVLVTPPDVRAGQAIELVVSTERFHLTARGEALNDGVIGQTIGVRRAADGRTVRGVVLGEGRVRLDQ